MNITNITREQEKMIRWGLMGRGWHVKESIETQISFLLRGYRDGNIADDTISVCEELGIKLLA